MLLLRCERVLTVINVFFFLKAPEELLDIMKDLQSCVDKAQEKKSKKKKKKQGESSYTTMMTMLPPSSFHILTLHRTGFIFTDLNHKVSLQKRRSCQQI